MKNKIYLLFITLIILFSIYLLNNRNTSLSPPGEFTCSCPEFQYEEKLKGATDLFFSPDVIETPCKSQPTSFECKETSCIREIEVRPGTNFEQNSLLDVLSKRNDIYGWKEYGSRYKCGLLGRYMCSKFKHICYS